MSIDTGVFDRDGSDSMSRRMFYLLIGGILTWGFILTAGVSSLTSTWTPNIWVFLAVGLGIPLIGVLMSTLSDNWAISFLGFNLVTGAFGALLGPVIAAFKVQMPGVVTEAAELTALITAVMALSGFAFPNFYEKIGGALFTALGAVIVVSLASLFIPALAELTIIHYAAAAVFALYIGFDMYRASQIAATVDNAVDVSVALYLDILNLFLQILKILANAKK